MSHLAEKAYVAGVVGTVAAAVAAPGPTGRFLQPAVTVGLDGLRWGSESLPQPAFMMVVMLGTTVAAVVTALAFARVAYGLARRTGPRTTRAYRYLTPNTPIGKVGVAFGLTMFFLVGSVWAIPYVMDDLGDRGPTSGVGNITNGSDGGTLLDDVDRKYRDALQKDVATHGDGPEGVAEDEAAYDRPRPDADGDRLRDGWERRGRTSRGVELPEADPDRKDLYVQINYGGGTTPLSAHEKRELKRVWASMPVDNPDGSEGITLHIDDDPRDGDGYGGHAGEQVSVSGRSTEEILQYYTAANLGQRRCRYHQVVFGDVGGPKLGGFASVPGFGAVVDDDRREYDGDVPYRVHVITHELLHNVVGDVDGGTHTREGWLSPTVSADDTFLSDASEAELDEGLAGSGYYQQRLCP